MRIRLQLTIAFAALGVASPSAAQVPDVSPGIQFAGCWTPADGIGTRARTCVVPSNGTLMLFNVDRDGKNSESTLRLDGEKTPLDSEGCSGWEQARLTTDGERLIVDGEVTCGTDPKQRVQTAFTITPAGYFLQTSGKGFGMIPNAGLRLFVQVETYADIPAEIRTALSSYLAESERARMRIRDSKVSANDIVELDQMGVVAPVLDVVVAAAYPTDFIIDATGGAADPQRVEQTSGGGRSPSTLRHCPTSLWMNGYPMLTMYDWETMFMSAGYGSVYGAECPVGYLGYNRYSRYGYGNPYGYGYGYGPYGYGYQGGGYTVVVVRPVPTGGASSGGGRAVRGRGYTEDGATSGTTAQPRNSVGTGSSSTRAAGSSSGSSSSGSSGSSGGSSSGGEPRTAKPRSP